jgi:hypothetical protein
MDMNNYFFRRVMISLLCGSVLSAMVRAEVPVHDLTSAEGASIAVVTLGGEPIGGDLLVSLRGGADTVVNDQMLNGSVHENQAYNLNTGGNLIGESSFAGSSGFATVIQNSGNNVLIQNSTNVNVQVK